MAASMNDLPNDSFQDLSFDNSINGREISQPCVMSNPSDPSYDSLISVSPSRSNVVRVSSARDYSLNIDKVLKKKIAAYRQVMAEYKCIGGVLPVEWILPLSNFFARHVANLPIIST